MRWVFPCPNQYSSHSDYREWEHKGLECHGLVTVGATPFISDICTEARLFFMSWPGMARRAELWTSEHPQQPVIIIARRENKIQSEINTNNAVSPPDRDDHQWSDPKREVSSRYLAPGITGRPSWIDDAEKIIASLEYYQNVQIILKGNWEIDPGSFDRNTKILFIEHNWQWPAIIRLRLYIIMSIIMSPPLTPTPAR